MQILTETEQVRFRLTYKDGHVQVVSAIHNIESLAIIPYDFDPQVSIDWTKVERVEWL